MIYSILQLIIDKFLHEIPPFFLSYRAEYNRGRIVALGSECTILKAEHETIVKIDIQYLAWRKTRRWGRREKGIE